MKMTLKGLNIWGLACLLPLLMFGMSVYGQNYTITNSALNAGNPGGVRTLADNSTTGTTIIQSFNNVSTTTNVWSDPYEIPFAFQIENVPVTHLMVSKNGLLTFDTTLTKQTVNPALNINSALPNPNLPNNTLAYFWEDMAPVIGASDNVYARVEGTAPNRQLWIINNSYALGTASYCYFAVVLEETTGKIHFIDMNYAQSPESQITATVGIQVNGTTAYEVSTPLNGVLGSPNIQFGAGNSPAIADNEYYTFEYFALGACLPPSNLNLTNISATTADVAWTTGNNLNAYLEYGPAGFTLGSGLNQYVAGSNNATITGLSPVTNYDVYVKDSCATSGSYFIGPLTFKTACASQLSGTVTINHNLPVSATNFHSFNELATVLNSCGYSGSLVVNVKEGVYNEQVSFKEFPSVLPSQTITIQADPSNTLPVEITDSVTISANNYIVNFDSASNMIFDGITVTGKGATYSNAITFSGTSHDVTVQNCVINAFETTTSSTNHVGVFDNNGSANKTSNIKILNNQINFGAYGVYFQGVSSSVFESGHVVKGNTIKDFFNYGIRVYYQEEIEISDNNIIGGLGTKYTTMYGVYNGYSDKSVVTGNNINITGPSLIYGLYNYYCDGDATTPNIVANNMVALNGNTGSTYGISCDYNYYTNIYYNSVNITDGNPTSSSALYFTSGTVGDYGNVNVLNNNIVNTGGGVAVEATTSAVSKNYVINSNNNNFYVTGAALVSLGSTSFTNLADYQLASSFDANSISSNPLFVGNSNLHVVGAALDGNAQVIPGITTDIDGDLRNATTPDIGADEFVPANCQPSTNINVVAAYADSVLVNWSAGSGAKTRIEYGPAGFTPGTGTIINGIVDTFYTIKGLTPATYYGFYLQDSCDVTTSSVWAGENVFATTFRIPADINCTGGNAPSIIYTEEFDSIPDWTGDIDGVAKWNAPGASATSGTGPKSEHSGNTNSYMYFESNNATNDTANIVSPLIDLTQASSDAELSFWMHAYGANMGTLNVGISTSATGPFTQIFTFSGQYQKDELDPWVNIGVNIGSYVGQGVYLQFQQIHSTGFLGDMAIDLIEINSCVSCPLPSDIGVASVTSNSADIYWTANTVTAWDVEYGETGFGQGTGFTMLSNNDTASITGLAGNTTYDFYVRGNCGSSDVSPWVGPITFTTDCNGQLNGTITLDPTMPKSATNFTSFKQLLNNLTVCGISGPVTVNIKEGVYKEQFVIDSIPGVSQANTIVLQSDPSNTLPVHIVDSSTVATENYTIKFNNASWVTLDNLSITAKGSNYSRVIDFSGTNNDITIQNSILTSTLVTSTAVVHATIYDGSTSSNLSKNISILNNEIVNGAYGIYLYGSSTSLFETGHKVNNNNIHDFYNYGIRAYYQDSIEIIGNEINSGIGQKNSTLYGIYNGYSDNSKVIGNKIVVNGPSTIYGIYNYYNKASVNAPNIVANNMISAIGNNSTTYGINVYYNFHTDVVYNSVNIENGSITTARAIYFSSPTTGDYGFVRALNNSLVNQGGGFVYEITSTASTLGYVTVSDYNNLYTTGSVLGRVGTTNYADLAAFQTGTAKDQNSISGDPIYATPANLHAISGLLDGVAQPIPGITTDIDGDVRNATTPDIGADEFTPSNCQPPSNAMAVKLYADSATVAWSSGTGTATRLEFGTKGYTPGTGTLITGILDTFYTIKGLMPITEYDFYLQDSCDVTSASIWVGEYSFRTVFELPTPLSCSTGGGSLIFTEEFITPGSWTGDLNGGNGTWEIPKIGAQTLFTGPDSEYSGPADSYMRYEASTTSADSGSIVSPAIDLSNTFGDAELSFWMHAYGIDMGTLKVGVGYTPTGPFTTEFSWSGQYQTSSSDPWVNIGVDLSSYVGQVIYLRFKQIDLGTSIEGDMSIDLVTVNACVSCPDPYALGFNSVNSTSADLYWTTGGASDWNIEYGSQGFTPGTGTLTNSTNDTVTISGLTQNFSYEFYVRDSCGLGDVSRWVGPYKFNSEVLTCDNFDIYSPGLLDSASSLFNGWNGNGGDAEVSTIEASSAPNSLRIYNTGVNTTSNIVAEVGTQISGEMNVEFDVFLPKSYGAYYNILHNYVSNESAVSAIEVMLDSSGVASVREGDNGTGAVLGTYNLNVNAWNNVKHIIDLDNDTAYIIVNGQVTFGWKFSLGSTNFGNQFNAVNFNSLAPAGQTSQAYYDNFCMSPYVITCADPTNLSATAGCTEADLTWSSELGANSTVYWSLASASVTTEIKNAASPLTLSGLVEGETYNFWVTDTCGNGLGTVLVGPFTFTTDTLPKITIGGTLLSSGSVVNYGFDVLTGAATADSITWNFGDGSTGKGPNVTHNYTANNTYTVVCVAYNACGTDTATTTALVEGIGLEDFNIDNLNIYPNPTAGVVKVEGLNTDLNNITVSVINALGQNVYSTSMAKGQESIEIDLSEFNNGVYYIRILTNKGVVSRPVVLQNK